MEIGIYYDCGYFVGYGNGLVWFPPKGSESMEPRLIPWSYFDENGHWIDEEEESNLVDE